MNTRANGWTNCADAACTIIFASALGTIDDLSICPIFGWMNSEFRYRSTVEAKVSD